MRTTRRIIFAELKHRQTGLLKAHDSEQTTMARPAVRHRPVEAYEWRPSDWETVRKLLA